MLGLALVLAYLPDACLITPPLILYPTQTELPPGLQKCQAYSLSSQLSRLLAPAPGFLHFLTSSALLILTHLSDLH